MTDGRRSLFGLLGVALLGSGLLGAAGTRLPDEVEKATQMRSHDAGARLLEDAVGNARADDLPWILLYAGELRRLSGDVRAAREHFTEVVERHADSGAKDAATLGKTIVDAAGAPSGNALATLALLSDKGVPDTLNAERYLLLAQAKAMEGAPAADVKALADKAEKYAAADRDLAKHMAKAIAALPAPGEPAPAPAGPPDLAAIDGIRAAVAAGSYDKVPGLVEAFRAKFADSPFAKEADYALRRAQGGKKIDPGLVAVLLPSTGTYAIPAETLRAAIELGNAKAGGAMKLAFFDTGGTPTQCVSALEKATLEQGAGLVIGPLLKEEALPCAAAAQALHVPMVTFTSSEEVLAAGDQVYRAFPSTEQLVAALLAETYDVRGLHRYAIVHPTTPYGENAARIFAEAVAAKGGAIAEQASYATDQKDFRSTAKALGKKDYKARAGEFAHLKAQATAAKQDPTKVVLPPLIDYDAIFVPDSYQRVALLASALAFEEFPVGRFRAHRDDTPLPLLGLNAWNNDELARRGGTYVQDSIFVDAFDAHSTAAAGFVQAWHDHASGDPTVVEAVAYDTTRLVAAAVAATVAGGDPIASLRAAHLDDPVAGTARFGDDREMSRTWLLLTVTREGIGPLAPPTPADPTAVDPTAPEGTAGH
jgi:ABC-type branched-subunit amino acid transport system substrate-binding protein